MKTWQKVAIVGAGLLAFSFLVPIFRSGDNKGQTLAQFIYHHSVFNKSDVMWIRKEELEKLRGMARGS